VESFLAKYCQISKGWYHRYFRNSGAATAASAATVSCSSILFIIIFGVWQVIWLDYTKMAFYP